MATPANARALPRFQDGAEPRRALRSARLVVAQLVECQALLVMRDCVIGIVLQHGLQCIDRVARLAAANLDLTPVNLGVLVRSGFAFTISSFNLRASSSRSFRISS